MRFVRIYEHPPEERQKKEANIDDTSSVNVGLDKFVLLVFEQIGGPAGPPQLVPFERLQALLIDTPLLHQFLSARFGEQGSVSPVVSCLFLH